jgi:uncharacterized protein YciI
MRFEEHALVMFVLRSDAPVMPPEQADALQDAHLAYTADLIAAGHAVAAGPLVNQDDERLLGMSVFAVGAEQARRLCSEDPAVLAGRLAVQVATWMVPGGQVHFERVRVPRSIADVKAPIPAQEPDAG